MQEGESFRQKFYFDQSDVRQFAELTGDSNPVHLDAEHAAGTVFKKPIVHGMLGAAVFSRILGVHFPGHGTIYLGQSLQFKRPMYPGVEYEAVVTVARREPERHRAHLTTEMHDVSTGKPVMTGEAYVMNEARL